jgi:hypothetical protein
VREREREREERTLRRGSEGSERGREDTRARKRERERESARERSERSERSEREREDTHERKRERESAREREREDEQERDREKGGEGERHRNNNDSNAGFVGVDWSAGATPQARRGSTLWVYLLDCGPQRDCEGELLPAPALFADVPDRRLAKGGGMREFTDKIVSLTFGRRPQLQRPQAAHARGREAEFTQVGGWDTSSDSYAGDNAVEESDEGDSAVEGSEEHFDENVAEEEDSTNGEDAWGFGTLGGVCSLGVRISGLRCLGVRNFGSTVFWLAGYLGSAHLDHRISVSLCGCLLRVVWFFGFFLGSHGTLVAVSAALMMPLHDSDIPMNVPFTFSNKQPLAPARMGPMRRSGNEVGERARKRAGSGLSKGPWTWGTGGSYLKVNSRVWVEGPTPVASAQAEHRRSGDPGLWVRNKE